MSTRKIPTARTGATRRKKHLFVSGLVSRSGTTLLQLVLSAHPDISVSPETHVIEWALRNMHPDTLDLDSCELEKFASNDVKLNSWPGFDFTELAPLFHQAPRTTVRDLMDRVFALHDARHAGDPVWTGNKKGLYGTVLSHKVKQIFPECRFLFICRDPRDSVPSILRNLRHQGVHHIIREILMRHAAINATTQAFPDSCLTIRFEDLVASPEPTCRRICQFLELPFNQAMLHFHEGNRDGELLLGATSAIHHNTRGPFDPALIARWRTTLDRDDAMAIQTGLRDVLTQYGYELLQE